MPEDRRFEDVNLLLAIEHWNFVILSRVHSIDFCLYYP